MAVKSRYNLVSSKSEYSRYYSMFRGVDLSQNATDIEAYRFSDATNVWKDPEAAQGGAIETFPGFRRLHTFPGKINGIHEWVGLDGVRRIAVHAGTHLYVFLHEERDLLHEQKKIAEFSGLVDNHSVSFLWQNVLYILDGSGYFKLDLEKGLVRVSGEAYIPISYSDGKEYEQRNMLSERFANRYGLENLTDYEESAHTNSSQSTESKEASSEFTFTKDDDGNALLTGFSESYKRTSTLRLPSFVSDGESTITVSGIANGAFCGLPHISTVIFPSSLISIGDNSFCDCGNLKGIYFTSKNGIVNCTRIGAGSFCRCGFESLAIVVGSRSSEQKRLYIENGAFANCEDLSVLVLSGNISIGSGVFTHAFGPEAFVTDDVDKGSSLNSWFVEKISSTIFTENNVSKNVYDELRNKFPNLQLKNKYSESELSYLSSNYPDKVVFDNKDTSNPYKIQILRSGTILSTIGKTSYRYSNGAWNTVNNSSDYDYQLMQGESFSISMTDYEAGANIVISPSSGVIAQISESGEDNAEFKAVGIGTATIKIISADSSETLLAKFTVNVISNQSSKFYIPLPSSSSSAIIIPDAINKLCMIYENESSGNAKIHFSESTPSITLSGSAGYMLYSINGQYAVFYAYGAETRTQETESYTNSYKFLIYDPCEEIISVTLDGQDISTVSGVSYTTETKGNLKTAVILYTNDPTLLEGATLTINGRGTDLATITGYSNAIAGNSAYDGSSVDAICGCRLTHIFDGRIFLSGNPELPNTVFYSNRMLNGETSPAYFGVLNYFNDGVGNSPVKALTSSGSVMIVLKGDTASEGSIYYHSGSDTGLDLIPRIYPSVQGLAGLGCISTGAAVNFLDDCVFVSRRGLESVGKQQVNLERSIEHRSYNIDARLSYEDLSRAKLCEWLGYLVLCIGANWYIADSRQIFEHRSGFYNYEWYCLDGFKTYRKYQKAYFTMASPPGFDLYAKVNGEWIQNTVGIDSLSFSSGEGIFANDCETKFTESEIQTDANIFFKPYGYDDFYPAYVFPDEREDLRFKLYYKEINNKKYIVDTAGEIIAPDTEAADNCCELCSVGNVLYFGCENGSLCCINNDKRGEPKDINGELVNIAYDIINPQWYAQDMQKIDGKYYAGRRYISGVTLKSDNCDIPHLTKTTRRNSVTIRCKSFNGTRFSLRCKTDFSSFEQLESVTLSNHTYSDIDYSAASFSLDSTQICVARNHNANHRRWVEQQFAIFSDKYKEPFGIYSLAFRYRIGGRIKI